MNTKNSTASAPAVGSSEMLAARIVNKIMKPGGSQKWASRLVLVDEYGRELSGWAAKPLINYIAWMLAVKPQLSDPANNPMNTINPEIPDAERTPGSLHPACSVIYRMPFKNSQSLIIRADDGLLTERIWLNREQAMHLLQSLPEWIAKMPVSPKE